MRQGRASLSTIPSIAQAEMQAHLPDPQPPRPCPFEARFLRTPAPRRALYAPPRSVAVTAWRILCFAPAPGRDGRGRPGSEAFVLRFFGEDSDDRLLVVNLGRDLPMEPPRTAAGPAAGQGMDNLWSMRTHATVVVAQHAGGAANGICRAMRRGAGGPRPAPLIPRAQTPNVGLQRTSCLKGSARDPSSISAS